MSTEQTPGAPTKQEWVEALAEHHLVASVGFHGGRWECSCAGWSSRYEGRREHLTHVAEALAPLIGREREAAHTEDMAEALRDLVAAWETRPDGHDTPIPTWFIEARAGEGS